MYDVGVRYIDISGQGGTDFIRIEYMRSGRDYREQFQNLGISTTVSLIEALSMDLPILVFASGGFTGGSDVVCGLTLGAKLVGMAGHFLRAFTEESEEGLNEHVDTIIDHLRHTMLMVGAANLKELTGKPLVTTGKPAEWLLRRGIDINSYSYPEHAVNR